MRLFLALNLPAAERDRLQRAAGPLRSARLPVRWVNANALHLTLKFLGEVPETRAAAIEAASAAVAGRFRPFALELQALGAFPSLRNPRVIWVGVHAPPELAQLAAEVETGMAELGFAPEGRSFSPHLTLGRVERDARAADFGRLPALAAAFDYSAQVRAESLDLMRSHLSPAGARYERLSAAPLGGEPAGSASSPPPGAAGTSSSETGP